MTTPATFLVVFCGTLAVVAVVRLLRGEEFDAVDGGTALVVVGITVAAAGWAGADHTIRWLLPVGLAAGALAVLAGAAIVARSWPGEPDRSGTESGSSRGP